MPQRQENIFSPEEILGEKLEETRKETRAVSPEEFEYITQRPPLKVQAPRRPLREVIAPYMPAILSTGAVLGLAPLTGGMSGIFLPPLIEAAGAFVGGAGGGALSRIMRGEKPQLGESIEQGVEQAIPQLAIGLPVRGILRVARPARMMGGALARGGAGMEDLPEVIETATKYPETHALSTAGARLAPRVVGMHPSLQEPSIARRIRSPVRTAGSTVTREGALSQRRIIEDLKGQIQDIVLEGTRSGEVIDPTQGALKALDELDSFYGQSVHGAPYRRAIDRVRQGFLREHPSPVTLEEAYKMHTTENVLLGEKAYGQLTPAQQEARKQLVRGIMDDIRELHPQLKGMGEEIRRRINLEKTIERAVTAWETGTAAEEAVPYMAGQATAGVVSPKFWTAKAISRQIIRDPAVRSKIAIISDLMSPYKTQITTGLAAPFRVYAPEENR